MNEMSIIIPAYNEEAYIGRTLKYLNQAIVYAREKGGQILEVIVVDNDSSDNTASIANTYGATIVTMPIHNIARVRNAGVRAASGNVMVLLDADTIIPESLLFRIDRLLSDSTYAGGSVDTDYRPQKVTVRGYLQIWRVIGKIFGMAQGAVQFFRKEVFDMIGGYDERFYMGEDVDFYWRLKKSARKQNLKTLYIEDMQVIPSCRRFDQWPFWRTVVWTNPFFAFLFRRWEKAWDGWYRDIIR